MAYRRLRRTWYFILLGKEGAYICQLDVTQTFGHSILFYFIFILLFNSIISTHLLLSLLFYSDNITTDTMNVSLSKKVVAAAISSSHGQGGGSG